MGFETRAQHIGDAVEELRRYCSELRPMGPVYKVETREPERPHFVSVAYFSQKYPEGTESWNWPLPDNFCLEIMCLVWFVELKRVPNTYIAHGVGKLRRYCSESFIIL